MNNNQELIARCREQLQGEDEPHSMEWYDMVEGLCNALEKTDKELQEWRKSPVQKAFEER